MFCEMRSNGGNQKGSRANPVEDKVGVHADVGSDFAVPITNTLEIIETKFKSIFVVCTLTQID